MLVLKIWYPINIMIVHLHLNIIIYIVWWCISYRDRKNIVINFNQIFGVQKIDISHSNYRIFPKLLGLKNYLSAIWPMICSKSYKLITWLRESTILTFWFVFSILPQNCTLCLRERPCHVPMQIICKSTIGFSASELYQFNP